MVRVLLLSMPNVYQEWSPVRFRSPWVGGTSLAGNCPDHDVYVGDLVLRRDDVKQALHEAIERTDPQVIGLSALTFQYPTAVRIARYIREQFRDLKNTPIALGGYHATSMRKEIARSSQGRIFDYIFAGEAERSFPRFLDVFEKRAFNQLESITGLSFRKGDRWVHNPRHIALGCRPGLFALRNPARKARLWNGFIFDTTETSRGCDFNCKFCSIRTMMPKSRYEAFPLDRVIEDIRDARSLGTKAIFFTDDNPALNPEIFEKLLDRIIDEGLNDIYFSGMYSTKSMSDPGLTKLMYRAGVRFAFLGIENIHQKNLKRMRKCSSEALAARAIDNLNEAGIGILAGLIVGNPDDTEKTIRANMQWFEKHPVDEIIPQFLTPYPGSVIRRELLKEGLLHNKNRWETYNGLFSQCRTRSGLTPAEQEAIVYEEHVEFWRSKLKLPEKERPVGYNRELCDDPDLEKENNAFERAKARRKRLIAMNRIAL